MTAEQGEASAQFCLGMLYDTGSKFPEYLDQGVPEDDMAAYSWFSVAAASGFDDGPRYRDSILRHCNMWNPPRLARAGAARAA